MLPLDPRARRALTSLLVCAVVGTGALAAAAPADAADRRIDLPYDRPSWAAASGASAVSPDTSIGFEIALQLTDAAGAEALAKAVSTPGTASSGAFVSPSDWIARFAPSQQTFDDTVTAAKHAGLTITGTPASRMYVIGRGTVDLVGRFFATRMRSRTVDGRLRFAAASAPSLPAAIGRSVAAVSFDRAPVKPAVQYAKRTQQGSCSTSYGQHTVTVPKAYGQTRAATMLCGYTPKQLRAIYGLDAGDGRTHRGSGQTVAVVGVFGAASMRRDLATFSKANGLPSASYREVLAPRSSWRPSFECDAEGWQGEQALDLEAAHAIAPSARLLFAGAGDCTFGVDLALSTVLDGGLASIVSNSYGSLGEDAPPAVQLNQHLQAAGEGIALLYASGDNGDESEATGLPVADFPATSPWVTAVGGTTTGLDRRGRLALSTGWGDSITLVKGAGRKAHYSPSLPGFFLGGAGGGVSTQFAAPAYQSGVVPTSLGHGMRTESDIAALASPFTGFAIGFRPISTGRYTTLTAGGTSLATPIVAGEVAIAQQRAGHALGFLNPRLYSLARTHPTAFRDVLPVHGHRILAAKSGATTFLITLGHDSSLTVRRGYDEVTGLGELTGGTLKALARG